MTFRPLIRPLLLALLALSLSACSFSLAEEIVPPANAIQPASMPTSPPVQGPFFPVVPPDPAAGQAIFAEKCAPCHGDSGLGDGPRASQLSVPVTPIGLPEVARQATPAEWFQIVTQGNLERFMPPFPSLNDRQRWDVVAYAFTLSDPIEDMEQTTALFQANCAACHGEQGLGDGPDSASLPAAPESFSDQAFMAELSAEKMYTSITNGLGSMPAFADKLSESERRSLAAYTRLLSFAGKAAPEQAAAEPAAGESAAPTQAITTTAELTTTISTGTLTVQVINGSGGEVPAGLAATVYAFDNMQFAISQTLDTSVEGVFTFDSLEFVPGRAFIASLDYQGSVYGSDVVVVEDASLPLTLDVMIYDTTTDTSGLVIDRMHLFFDFSTPDMVQVVELYVVSNPTDKAITAAEEGGAVLSYFLPEGATNLQFQDGMLGERYMTIPGGFADTQMIPPSQGEYQVVFAFNLPYDRKLKFVQPLNLAVNATVVLLPDVGVKINAEGMEDAGSRDIEGTAYQMFNGASQPAGGEIVIELSGTPRLGDSALDSLDDRTTILIGLGALGAVLVLSGLWLFLRGRSQAASNEEDEEDDEAEVEESLPAEDADTLMDKIIALDDLFREGKLPEDAYQQRRAELKARLEQAVKE